MPLFLTNHHGFCSYNSAIKCKRDIKCILFNDKMYIRNYTEHVHHKLDKQITKCVCTYSKELLNYKQASKASRKLRKEKQEQMQS